MLPIDESLISLQTLIDMKFKANSLATTAASSVLPVPGGPYSSKPEHIRIGHCANSFGY